MNPQTPKHYIILVHFGSPEITTRALSALFSGTQLPTEVVVIDHGHQPYSAPPRANITVIRPQQNAGYAAGVNSGLGFLLKKKIAKADTIVAMNNDVVVSPTTLSQLVLPANTLMGPRGGHINWLTGRTQLDKEPLSYLDGAFLAATRSTWDKLLGMPTDYFLYWEDVALSYRGRQRGIKLKVVPTLNIHHQPSHQHRPTEQQLYYLVKNGARFLEQAAPLGWRLYWWPTNRLRYVYHRYCSSHPHASLISRALYDAITS